MSTPAITALRSGPAAVQGLVRDLRARWAFEEVGQPYQADLVHFAEIKGPAHRERQPFGQVPTFDDGEVRLFESGAIVMHIARKHPGLLPADPAGEARAVQWMFAALTSIEPWIFSVQLSTLFERDQPWSAARLPFAIDKLHGRLDELETALGEDPWLDGATFTAGDLLMVTVLRQLHRPRLLDGHPALARYVARGEERPAFVRAMAAHIGDFDAAA